MRNAVPILAALLLATGCNQAPSTDVEVTNPVIRLPAVPGRPGAGYFHLRAPQDRVALTAVTTPAAERVEMHETMSEGNMASMRPVRRIEVGREIAFAPGGRHLMLFGVSPELKAGETTDLTFQFEQGAPVTVSARVIGAGDALGGEHDGH
ncbi:copper chaperone PCu(A)C [Sphingosinicella sp. LHD-64]|uniref:copper chaperone PCu(A)C n=1 Tax=Sphingosinicella sp. LHD-64 TaxID=3072139 RepID=UPI00280EB068|nr:copper chaperone PCu(A)C [Sphingosinicella sp. LHD-64]MDQ8756421.1 copper chaperone PCu(A)C [Sphingosinicella sp. LHD-64]